MINKTLDECFFVLAFKAFSFPDYNFTEKLVIEGIKDHPLYSLMAGTIINDNGNIIKRKPSLLSEDNEEQKSSKWTELLINIMHHHRLIVRTIIDPIREQICTNYYFNEDVFIKYCRNNSFIQEGQEYLYAKGLYSGLIGDFISSTSLLIPLLENSLRYVLEQNGEVISTFNNNNIQEYIRINAILDNDKLINCLGENLVNDLKVLLVEPAAYSYRNKLSHGLLTIEDYFQDGTCYLWAIVLRLVLVPYYNN